MTTTMFTSRLHTQMGTKSANSFSSYNSLFPVTSPRTEPRYRPAPNTQRRSRFIEDIPIDPTFLPSYGIAVFDFAYPAGEPDFKSVNPVIKVGKDKSERKKKCERLSENGKTNHPKKTLSEIESSSLPKVKCDNCTARKDFEMRLQGLAYENLESKEGRQAKLGLQSGETPVQDKKFFQLVFNKPLQRKSKPKTPALKPEGIVTVIPGGKAHPGQPWIPGAALTGESFPSSIENGNDSPAMLYHKSISPHFHTRIAQAENQTFAEFMQQSRAVDAQPVTLGLAMVQNGPSTALMSGAVADPGMRDGRNRKGRGVEEMEFVTIPSTIQEEISRSKSRDDLLTSARAETSKEAPAAPKKGEARSLPKPKSDELQDRPCPCPCCKKPTLMSRIKNFWSWSRSRDEEVTNELLGKEKGKKSLREVVPRMDLKIQRQLGL